MMEKILSIVVPCYNEEKNIPLLLDRFQAVISNVGIEVILVNNGSTDNSAQVLAERLPHYPFARTVLVPNNQGYGYGILAGLRAAEGEFLGWTHADLQTDPKDVLTAFTLIQQYNKNEKIYIKGKRVGRRLFDNFFTIGMSIFETLYLKMGLWEINAQPNIFHRSFFQQWETPPHDFSLDLYAYYLAKKKNLTIVRFPVHFSNRVHGVSSWNTSFMQKMKFIKRTITFSSELKQSLKLKGL